MMTLYSIPITPEIKKKLLKATKVEEIKALLEEAKKEESK